MLGIEKVGEVEYTLDQVDFTKVTSKEYDSNGILRYKLWLDLNIELSDEAGLLVFRILHEGKECGKAKLGFSFT